MPPHGAEGEGEGEGELPLEELRFDPASLAVLGGANVELQVLGSFGAVSYDVDGQAVAAEGASFTSAQTVARHEVVATDEAERTATLTVWSVGDPSLWLRSDDIDGDGAPDARQGRFMDEWRNRTGGIPHLIQESANHEPEWVVEGDDLPNGHPVVRFDGLAAALEGRIRPEVNAQAMSIAAVVRTSGDVPEADQELLSSEWFERDEGDDLDTREGWGLRLPVGDRWEIHGSRQVPEGAGTRPVVLGTPARRGRWELVVGGVTDGRAQIRTNRTAAIEAAVEYTPNTRNTLRIGTHRNLGDGEFVLRFFEGDLAEVILHLRSLADHEVAVLEAYLAQRYPTDSDADGLEDWSDRCIGQPGGVRDADDTDGDGLGDVCDTCPDDFDPTDADLDGDGLGDACDPDDDDDGALDVDEDDCGTDPRDPMSNEATWDADGDGECNAQDDCPDDPDDLCDLPRPLAHWRFDDDRADSSGNGYHLPALVGDEFWDVFVGERFEGRALRIARGRNVDRLATVLAPQVASASYIARVGSLYTPGVDGYVFALATDGETERSNLWALRVDGLELEVYYEFAGAQNQAFAVAQAAAGQRYFTTVGVVFDQGTVRLYLEGRGLIAVHEGAPVPVTQAPRFAVGSWATDPLDKPLNGSIEDLRIYDRPLTHEQMMQIIPGPPGP